MLSTKRVFQIPLSIWLQATVFLFFVLILLNSLVKGPSSVEDASWDSYGIYEANLARTKVFFLSLPIVLLALVVDVKGFSELERSLREQRMVNTQLMPFIIHAHPIYRNLKHSQNALRSSAAGILMRVLVGYYFAQYGFALLKAHFLSQYNVLFAFPPIAGWYVISVITIIVFCVLVNEYIWSPVLPVILQHILKLSSLEQPKSTVIFFVLGLLARLTILFLGMFITEYIVPWECGVWCIQVIPVTVLGFLFIVLWVSFLRAKKASHI